MTSPGLDGARRPRRSIGVLGVPSSAGARQIGQEGTPALFRRIGLLDLLADLRVEVLDYGDLPTVAFSPDRANPRSQNLAPVATVARHVARKVSLMDEEGSFPLVIGGDCTITIGVVAGLIGQPDDLGLVYFDGDIDLNTPASTSTGIFDGMGMAHVLGRGAEELSAIGGRSPLLDEGRVVLFGFQDGWLDDTERTGLSSAGMALFPRSRLMDDPGLAAEEAVLDLQRKTARYIVHLDVDVVDHSEQPVADVPHFGGLSLGDTERCLAAFLGRPSAAALVLTEFNALQDPHGRIAHELAELIARCLRPRFERTADRDPG